MKVITNDEFNIIIFLNKIIVENIDLEDRENLEEYFKKIFLKLKKIYDITISGYFVIDVYIDDNYGIIMELNKEELDYYEYFDNQIDMRIIIHDDVTFLYEIDDILLLDKKIRKNISLYYYQNKYYIKINKILNFIALGYILENSNSIYIDENDNVINDFNLIKI